MDNTLRTGDILRALRPHRDGCGFKPYANNDTPGLTIGVGCAGKYWTHTKTNAQLFKLLVNEAIKQNINIKDVRLSLRELVVNDKAYSYCAKRIMLHMNPCPVCGGIPFI